VDSGALRGHTVVEVYKGRWRRLRLSENSHGGEEHNNRAREIFALSTEKKWGREGGGVPAHAETEGRHQPFADGLEQGIEGGLVRERKEGRGKPLTVGPPGMVPAGVFNSSLNLFK
jgi:hypothetical protein